MKNLKDIPFDIKHLENDGFIPTDEDKKRLKPNEVEHMIWEFNKKQKDVLFSDCSIEYDSNGDDFIFCDWPYKINFKNSPKAEIYFEDEGLCIENDGYYLKIPDLRTISMQDFVDCLNICKVKFKLKNN